jgi:GT2 family glycosyltransferase
VNYNSGSFLLECVATALPEADEVIIVDNRSSDSSIAECEQQFYGDPKLKFISNGANLGFATACNIGARHCSGDFLLFLNPDCALDSQATGELVHTLESDSTAGMAGGLLINPDGSEQGGGRRAVPTPWRSFVRAFGLNRYSDRWPKLFFDFHLHKQPLPEQPIEVEAISGACMLVKREAMDDVGPWDEAYFLHCEDLDWCMRFRRNNWKILFVPSARVVHALGVCSRSNPIFVQWHKHKGMLRFYRKFFLHQYPGVLMWLVAIGVWLRFIAVVANYSFIRVMSFLGIKRG